MHQQVGDEAGKQRSWTDADDIGAGNGVESLRKRLDIGWNEEKFLDANFAGRDFSFSTHASAIFHQRFEFDVGSCGGMYMAASDENFRGQAHSFREVIGDVG